MPGLPSGTDATADRLSSVPLTTTHQCARANYLIYSGPGLVCRAGRKSLLGSPRSTPLLSFVPSKWERALVGADPSLRRTIARGKPGTGSGAISTLPRRRAWRTKADRKLWLDRKRGSPLWQMQILSPGWGKAGHCVSLLGFLTRRGLFLCPLFSFLPRTIGTPAY